MFGMPKGPFVQIDLSVHVEVYDTSTTDMTDGVYVSPIKKSCHFKLHVKKNTCVEEAFDETFHHAKELLETAMKEEVNK